MSKVISFRVPDAMYGELLRVGADSGWTPHQMARAYMLSGMGETAADAAIYNASVQVQNRLKMVMSRLAPEIQRLVVSEMTLSEDAPIKTPFETRKARARALGRADSQITGDEDYEETVQPYQKKKKRRGKRGGRGR